MKGFIEMMPKAELHVHLEGTMEPELRLELASRNGINHHYDSAAAIVEAYDFHDLSSFLKIYYEGVSVLLHEDDFYQLTWNYLERAHAQRIIYAELFFDPQAHTRRGVDFSTIIKGIHRAQSDARNYLGVDSQLIMCFLRELSAESAMLHLEMATPYLEWIIGVGLDSDEKDNPPIKFSEVFRKARSLDLKLTMHCDVNQENSVDHIWQCINEIGVDRIDHGLNALEDPALCQVILNRGLGLTVCPISNQVVVQSLTQSEIRRMLESGLMFNINSDDPGYLRAYLNQNLIKLQKAGNFSNKEILTMVRNSFEMAWIPRETKDQYISKLLNFVNGLT